MAYTTPNHDFNTGDIVRMKKRRFGYRVFSIGDAQSHDILHIFIEGKHGKVHPNDVEKVVDIRENEIASCIDEWFCLPPEARRTRIKVAIKSRPLTEWHDTFLREMNDSLELFDALVVQVKGLLERDITHWSMKTIFEYLRHSSALSDTSAEFKLNNNAASGMARLMKIMFPEIGDLFSFRNSICHDIKVVA